MDVSRRVEFAEVDGRSRRPLDPYRSSNDIEIEIFEALRWVDNVRDAYNLPRWLTLGD